ncbi:hypothetical protein BJY04DRAFT_216649 [Aspergillus karnatakaensis]|uniref:DUF3632 domain-containing protein n=1 Tax=Aspergillus karnatakaensis TaxID=1810916 RepID=UPI003CCDCEA5
MALPEPTRYLNPSILPTLHALLSNESTPYKTACNLASTTLTAADIEDLEGRIWHLWAMITTLASKTPDAEIHDNLVQTLIQLSRLPGAPYPSPTPESTTGASDTHGCNMVLWQDLPMLSLHLAEQWAFFLESAGHDSDHEISSELVNLNRFVAAMVASREEVFSSYASYALVTLHEGLERERPSIHRHSTSTAGSKEENRPNAKAWILASAGWIEVLGGKIYGWTEEEWEWEAGVGIVLGTSEPLWNGKSGFCKERWVFWRERFGVIARDEDGSVETRRVAGEAEGRI